MTSTSTSAAYVDNTPDPEPEDVTAHLQGGVPKSEVAAQEPFYKKFGMEPKRILSGEAS
jgi:type I restriction enzyme M protein